MKLRVKKPPKKKTWLHSKFRGKFKEFNSSDYKKRSWKELRRLGQSSPYELMKLTLSPHGDKPLWEEWRWNRVGQYKERNEDIQIKLGRGNRPGNLRVWAIIFLNFQQSNRRHFFWRTAHLNVLLKFQEN